VLVLTETHSFILWSLGDLFWTCLS